MAALNSSRFKQAEYERNIWVVTPEAETPLEALLNPAFWAHVASSFKPWDHIEVRAEDGSYWAELLVQDASRNWAKVAVLRQVQLNGEAPRAEESDGHIVEWSGPHTKWRVVRKADKAILKDSMSKADANKWLAEHLRVVA